MTGSVVRLIEKASEAWDRFARDTRGSIAILTAMTSIPLVGAIALGVDYGRILLAQRDLQSALDAAVLASASAQINDASSNVSSVVTSYVSKTFAPKVDVTALQVTASRQGNVITASGQVTVPTPFASVLGSSSSVVTAVASATFGTGDAEIALVLDNTGSMSGAKIDGLKAAARELVTTLYSFPNASTHIRFGLVPFTYYVNVGTSNRTAAWMDVPDDYSTTTNQCWDTYPNAVYTNPRTVNGTCYNDGTPYACSWTEYDVSWGNPVTQCGPVTSTYTWYGCAGSRSYPLNTQDGVLAPNRVPGIMNASCPAPLTRLTASKQTILDQIDAMTASGETYIAPGLLWGWRVLSPNAPFADAAAFGGNVRKFIVLMTDGANTRSPLYPDHEGGDTATANQITAEICTNIKASGITIFTIGFDVTDATLVAMLSGCASSSSYAYTAATVTDLQTAFQKIGQQMTAVRLSQ